MKLRKIGFFIVFAALLIMAACGTGDKGIDEKPANQTETPVAETPAEASQNPPEVSDEQSESTAFRNITVTGENGEYIVKGEVRVFEAVYFYAVEDGHEYLIEETRVTANEGAPAWSPFELTISIPEDQLPVNGALTMELYEKSAKDGSIINETYVKLDEFGN